MQAYCVEKYPSSFGWWVKPRVQAIALCAESGVGQEEHSRAGQGRTGQARLSLERTDGLGGGLSAVRGSLGPLG